MNLGLSILVVNFLKASNVVRSCSLKASIRLSCYHSFIDTRDARALASLDNEQAPNAVYKSLMVRLRS